MIELPILFHDDTTKSLEDLGVTVNMGEFQRRLMTFYVVDAINPYEEKDFSGTQVHSGGQVFVCPYTYEQLKKILNGKSSR